MQTWSGKDTSLPKLNGMPYLFIQFRSSWFPPLVSPNLSIKLFIQEARLFFPIMFSQLNCFLSNHINFLLQFDIFRRHTFQGILDRANMLLLFLLIFSYGLLQ
ncbi:hypothetical protein FGO68_gene2634 [Halteria grandinella]|uniref:Uncharacterized protein n=1 Tax=Halteria grandinella TaxID=5974 RepID=A0A8J8NNV9_HALGN|nr:hypothetical protein FGO68_gene2634 [Halteria grandinella]